MTAGIVKIETGTAPAPSFGGAPERERSGWLHFGYLTSSLASCFFSERRAAW